VFKKDCLVGGVSYPSRRRRDVSVGITSRTVDWRFNLHHGERQMNWYLQALKKYADFSGRARRKEYWFFILFYLIILIVLMIIDGFVGT
jgi:uncharacterized protein DUF805